MKKLIILITLMSFIVSCISPGEVYHSYSKGGHPAGKSKAKHKNRYE